MPPPFHSALSHQPTFICGYSICFCHTWGCPSLAADIPEAQGSMRFWKITVTVVKCTASEKASSGSREGESDWAIEIVIQKYFASVYRLLYAGAIAIHAWCTIGWASRKWSPYTKCPRYVPVLCPEMEMYVYQNRWFLLAQCYCTCTKAPQQMDYACAKVPM